MFGRFVITLVSSWIINPMPILVAHWFGVANAPIIISVLLATSACAPFQILINECLAAAESRGSTQSTWKQLLSLIAAQFVACSLSVKWFASQHLNYVEVLTIAALLSISTLLSHQASLRYFRLVIVSSVPLRSSVLVGALPGITSLFLYLAYCGDEVFQTAIPSDVFIFASLLLPAVVQWRYLVGRPINSIVPTHRLTLEQAAAPSTGLLFAAAVGLAVLAASGTSLREAISLLNTEYTAVVLVALNSVSSLINTATRAAFIRQSRNMHRKQLASSVAGTAVASAAMFTYGSSGYLFVALLCTQLSVAWIIESVRRASPLAP